MPRAKKNTYKVEKRKYATFEKAAAAAIDLSLRLEDAVTITEYGQAGTYNITVQAQSEQAE